MKTSALGNNKYANNATKYYVASQNSVTKAWTITTYTGYATTTIKGGNTQFLVDADGNGVAEIVFVNGGVEAGAEAKYVYITGSYTSDGQKKTYDVIVNGAADKMVLTNASIALGLYNVENGEAKDIPFTADVALNVASKTAGIYGKTIKFFTYDDGILLSCTEEDGTYTYLCNIDATVPVYTFAKGECSTSTAADLTKETGSMIVIVPNAAGTAIAAIYILA